MGQLRSKSCPVCAGENDGRWTCPPCTLVVNVHRELIRNLQIWHSLHEAQEVTDTMLSADGQSYCLWDIDRLYAERHRLPERQRRAMELCLYDNVAEKTAASLMGIAETNPVSVYATVGLSRLLGWAYAGELPTYRLRSDDLTGGRS